MFTLLDRTEMDKSTVIKAAFTVTAIPLVVSAANATAHVVKPPAQSTVYSWPFLVFLGLVVLGAVAAIIWEVLTDKDAS
mgnify:CR=1 FL=1